MTLKLAKYLEDCYNNALFQVHEGTHAQPLDTRLISYIESTNTTAGPAVRASFEALAMAILLSRVDGVTNTQELLTPLKENLARQLRRVTEEKDLGWAATRLTGLIPDRVEKQIPVEQLTPDNVDIIAGNIEALADKYAQKLTDKSAPSSHARRQQSRHRSASKVER